MVELFLHVSALLYVVVWAVLEILEFFVLPRNRTRQIALSELLLGLREVFPIEFHVSQ